MTGLSAFRKIALAATVVAAAGLGVAASSTGAAAEWDHGGGWHHGWRHGGWHQGGWRHRGWGGGGWGGGGWGYGGYYGGRAYVASPGYSGENCATRSRWVLGPYGWHRVVWRGCRYDQ